MWACPFHPDRNPSFQVDPARGRWKCWPCGAEGDAIELVKRIKGIEFREDAQIVAELAGLSPSTSTSPRPAASKPAKLPAEPPSGLDRQEAERIVAEAAERILEPEGRQALEYLRDRGLSDETVRRHRIGWTPRVNIIRENGTAWTVAGITIPWFNSGRLAMLKIRQDGDRKPKYVQVFSDSPSLYPDPNIIEPGLPLVVCEGELDAALLGQELAGLASVVSLGSASSRPEGATFLAMLAAPKWFVAHDRDPAGDRAAGGWPGRAVRVRPPVGKDWTDARQAGINLRRWWIENELVDAFDREERAAIFEFCGNLGREEADRLAGIENAAKAESPLINHQACRIIQQWV